MKKLELEIMGGLGNQLFQYTVARYFQKKLRYDKLCVNFYGYKNYKIRNFELENFELAPDVEITKRIGLKTLFLKESFHVLHKLYHVLVGGSIMMKEFRIGKDAYIFTDIEVHNTRKRHYSSCNNIYMYGYFVSSKIAEVMRPYLMNEISLKDGESNQSYELIKEMRNHNNVIGVSIRCDVDYVNNGWPICTPEYYRSGIRRIIGDKSQDFKILIFADNINKVKSECWFDEFDDNIMQYIEGYNVCESFEILRNCNYFVCSNSSFSWWGAFLNYNESNNIYMPDVIFSENHSKADQYMKMPDCIILDHKSGEAK